MADYSISTEITLEDSKFSKGVKNAQNSTKKLSSSLNKVIQGFGKGGLAGAISSAGLALGGIGLAVNTAIKGFQAISKAINECTSAYKNQLVVERALDTAISNSPFVSGSASKSLKEFANEMQRTSNLGDEEVIPMMTQLVATGRNEAEVMQIIKTASDMASSGAMSFDTAVTQLNATLNGNIGRLGQQNAELKGLTEEELKSGKAVEILAEKYKGLSEATIDTSKQLQNIKGDFKEALGQFTLPSSDMWNKFWTGFYEKGIAILNQFNDYLDRVILGEVMSEKIIANIKSIKDERQKQLYIEDEVHTMTEKQLTILQNYYKSQKHLSNTEKQISQTIQWEIEGREYLNELYKEMDEEEAKRQKTIEAQKEAENEIVKLKEEYLKKIAEQEAKWKNIEAVTGETVENEEKIKFYQDSLVDLMTKAGGQITTNNQLYKDQVAIIQELQKGLKPEEQKTSTEWAKKLREQTIERLEAEKKAELERLELKEATEVEIFNVTSYYNDKLRELNRQKIEEERQQALESVKDYANAQEEKARINQYYDNELLDNNLKFIVDLKKQNTQIPNGFAEGFKKVISSAKEMSKKVIKIFSDVAKTVKSIFSTGKSIFSKIFEFNPDEALNNLLVFEDKVLTFFVETLPKLPQFFASAFESVSVLLQNVMNSGGLDIIGGIINSIIESAINNIPNIVKMLGQLIMKIVDNLVPILDRMIPTLFDVLINIVEKLMSKLPQLVTLIVKFLSNIIQKIVKKLPALLKAILPNLLKAVLELVRSLLKELPKIITVIINALPEIITTLIKALADFLGSLKGNDLALFIKGVVQAVTQIANALIKNIGKIVAELIPLMVQIVVELIKSIPDILKGLATGVWEGIKDVGASVWEGIKNVGEGIKNIGKSIVGGLKKLFGFATGTNNAPKGLALVGEAGPELVNFKGGERVYNATNTAKMLSNAGAGGNVFNVTFENTVDTTAFAMMKQLKQYQRNLAFNGVL